MQLQGGRRKQLCCLCLVCLLLLCIPGLSPAPNWTGPGASKRRYGLCAGFAASVLDCKRVAADEPPGASKQTIRYGPFADQVGDLWLPASPARGVVALIHGGFWYSVYDRSLMNELAQDLISRGLAAWNLEYRRTDGASWTGPQDTFDDIVAGLDSVSSGALPGLASLPAAVVGHSAGGHLAIWSQLTDRHPKQRFEVAVSAAGVLDLRRAEFLNMGGGAVQNFLRCHAQDVSSTVSPLDMLPQSEDGECSRSKLSSPHIGLVHGQLDFVVPMDQSTQFKEAAECSGISVELRQIGFEGHFEVLKPQSKSWTAVMDLVESSFKAKSAV